MPAEQKNKSYYLLGNLPIYNTKIDRGSHDPIGCDFVINSRIKYEYGICSLQFINQKHPSMYNTDAFNPEVELDLSSLIRLRRLLLSRNNEHISKEKYIQITSTKLQQKINLQKSAFVSVQNDLNDSTVTIIMDSKQQESFKICGLYQVESFIDLIELIIQTLSKLYGEYDMQKLLIKNNDVVHAPPVHTTTHTPIITPSVNDSNIPPPVIGSPTINSQIDVPPVPITSQLIVQAPPAPTINKGQ